MKQYKCECQYALFPFGPGMPVCVRDRIIEKSERLPLRECIEKGCPHYKKLNGG